MPTMAIVTEYRSIQALPYATKSETVAMMWVTSEPNL